MAGFICIYKEKIVEVWKNNLIKELDVWDEYINIKEKLLTKNEKKKFKYINRKDWKIGELKLLE